MNTMPVKKPDQPTPSTIEDVLIRGDLSKLTENQRNQYYMQVCQSLGLNYLTRPFDYLMLSGKLTLYAKRDCADQLRKINGISIQIVGQDFEDGLYTVHARATDKTGRSDEDFGVVAFKNAGNEFSANAKMKAITKAKRRVTLSISGLGLLDETEIAEPVQHRAPEPLAGLGFQKSLHPAAAGKGNINNINEEQRAHLLRVADELDADIPQYLEYLSERWQFDVLKLADIPEDNFTDALEQLERKRRPKMTGEEQKRLGEEAERIQQRRAHDPITGEVSDATP